MSTHKGPTVRRRCKLYDLCFRFNTLFPLEAYKNLNDIETIKEILLDSDSYTKYPKAKITDAIMEKIRTEFNTKVAP